MNINFAVAQVAEYVDEVVSVKMEIDSSVHETAEGPAIDSVNNVQSIIWQPDEIDTDQPKISALDETIVEETKVNKVQMEETMTKEIKAEQMFVDEQPANEERLTTPQSTIPLVKQPSSEEPSNTDQPTDDAVHQESTVDSISVKIEQIEIETKPKDVPREPVQNIIDIQISDIKPPKFGSEEATIRVKCEDVKPEKESESPSALIDLPKEMIEQIADTSIRRSGRIRTINKTKQRSQGFGLVKDKKRMPVVVDEDSSSAGFDASTDNTLDKDALQTATEAKVRIKSEEEMEKEKIDRENGMKLFIPIMDNEYRSERTISKEAKKMTCDCFLTQSEIERGELGCGDDCLNRMLLIECSPKCIVGDRCTNRRFQKHQNSACNIFKTEKKGYGLIATSYIPAGVFIMEYVGEVLNSKQFEKRANDYSKQMNAHYYFMALSSDCVIDATKKGNISRFINHSCDPNAETQKWTVNGELRIGFFSTKPITPDEEITFDYQFQRYGYAFIVLILKMKKIID